MGIKKKRLSTLVKNHEDSSLSPFPYAPRSIVYPVPIGAQADLFEGDKSFEVEVMPANGIRGKVGLYAELLWARTLSGKLNDNYEFEENGEPARINFNLLQPDIYVPGKNWFAESKVLRPGSELKLRDEQMQRYEWLQLDADLERDRTLFFIISRYNIRSLEKTFKKKALPDLLSALTKSFVYSVFVPFSIIHELHETKNEDLVYWWHPTEEDQMRAKRVFNSMTRVRSQAVNALFSNQEEIIETLGLSTSDYRVARTTFPEGTTVNGLEVSPFPVTFIDHRGDSHADWLGEFRANHQEEVEKYRKAEEDQIKRLEESMASADDPDNQFPFEGFT